MQTHHRHQRSAARLLAPVIIVTPWRLRLRPSVRPPVAADRPPSQWGMLSLTRSQSSWVMTIFKWRALDTGRALTNALGRSEIGGVIHYKFTFAASIGKSPAVKPCVAFTCTSSSDGVGFGATPHLVCACSLSAHDITHHQGANERCVVESLVHLVPVGHWYSESRWICRPTLMV